MKTQPMIVSIILILLTLSLPACQASPQPTPSAGLHVLAAESFIADMAQNVAGERLVVDTLMPLGLDPHAFEPTPQDVVKISSSDLVIVNGAGFEEWLQKVIENSGGKAQVVEASKGLASRTQREGELPLDESSGVDPHFWLDPTKAIHYVENIRDGLIQLDPLGKAEYTRNAENYIAQLTALDQQIQAQVSTIVPEKRLIVTNHESFGYFADRYGFKIIGTIIPSVSTGASPSAQQLANLIDHIKSTHASAIFLETGTNPQMADQISRETDILVVTDLYTHSITAKGGIAPSYIAMMNHNIQVIVNALK